MTKSRNQLVCLLTHQTQYDPPLWHALGARGQIEPIVYYSSNRTARDQEIGEIGTWRADFDVGIGNKLTSITQVLDRHRESCVAVFVPGWTKALTWRALSWCRSRGVPVILPSDKTLNEPGRRGTARWAEWIFHANRSRLFDAFFTTGILGVQSLRRLGIPRERIATGQYPIDVTWWRRQAEAAGRTGQDFRKGLGGEHVYLSVCKLNSRENPHVIVEAFERVAHNTPGARLVMVGNGPLENELANTVREKGLADKVRLVGRIPYEDLAKYYVAADVFVHAPAREPWGISVSEAMACGLTVAATTTVGSAADLVIPGRTGALAHPGDPVSLAEAMRTSLALATLPGTRDTIAREVARMDVDTVAANLEGLIGDLAAEASWTKWPDGLRDETHNIYGGWPL